ncbi:MAG: hypothetical protein Q9174_005214 [Haloplaca sp. 1 TL-2023]
MLSNRQPQGTRAHVSTVHALSDLTPPSPPSHHTVVIHNTKMPIPAEDWTLFPDEVVTIKHTSIRKRKTESVYVIAETESRDRNEKTAGPTMLPTPPDSNPSNANRKIKRLREDASKGKAGQDLLKRPTSSQLDHQAVAAKRDERTDRHPHRLPTPDISDVDEDEMWPCGGSGGSKA